MISSRDPKTNPGFTWVEALMTVAVLAVGCLALLSLRQSSFQDSSRIDQAALAGTLAKSQLELAKGGLFDQWGDGRYRLRLNRYGETCRVHLGEACYETIFTIKRTAPNSRLVSLEISWEEAGQKHGQVYETLITGFSF